MLLGAVALVAGLFTSEPLQLFAGVVLLILGAFGERAGPLTGVGAGPTEGIKVTFGERVERAATALEDATSNAEGQGVEQARQGLEQARELLPAAAAIGPSKILWVDDTPERNDYEATMLSAIGAALTQVRSSQEALAEIERDAFDVIITDLLRDGDPNAGINFLRALRDAGVATDVVVYTYDPNGRHDKAIRLGARAVTRTPPQLLEAVVRALLGRQLKALERKSVKAP